ncbi:MAG TPA: hypothetical protein VN368_02005 [Candidatus Methylomirabilis sp.]|nr:hypothetical protein [Candidatus Methylomirabilis sp.]
MTYCSTLFKPLTEKIEAGQSLDEIAESLCGETVGNPRAKALRMIRTLLGEAYLRKHADTLRFDVKKSVRVKGLSTNTESRKIEGESQAKEDAEFAFILSNLRKLVKKYEIEMIREALLQIENEKDKKSKDD